MSKLSSIFATLRLKKSAPEYNPSVLDHLPKNGFVGYTTNNPRLAFLLLSEPAERFGFHVKDFSTFGSALGFDAKFLAVGAYQREYKFEDMYINKVSDGGDVFHSNTVFTHQFPKNIEEARIAETKNGGINLFMHLEFSQGVEHTWNTDNETQVLECASCGKVVPKTEKLMDIKSNPESTINDILIGENVECNQITALCEWKENRINEEEVNVNNFTDLHEFYDKRGVFMKFKIENDIPLNRARVDLLKNIASCFKL